MRNEKRPVNYRPLFALVVSAALFVASVGALPAAAVDSNESDLDRLADQDGLDHNKGDPTVKLYETPEEMLTHTAELLSKSGIEGINSVDDAVAVLEHQARVDQVIETLVKVDPDIYSGAITESGSARIFVKGELSNRAAQAVGDLPSDIVLVDGRAFSFDELNDQSTRIGMALFAAGLDAETGVQSATETIEVLLSGGENRSAADRIVSGVSKDGAKVEIATIEAEGQLATDAFVFGGELMQRSGGGRCTTGFSVKSGSQYGIITAAHCSGTYVYNHASNYNTSYPTHSMSYQAQHNGANGDFEWRTVSGTEKDDFYATTTARYDVSSVRPSYLMYPGNTVCRFGRASNTDGCTSIILVGASINGAGSLVRTGDTGMVTGDSGGPWYNGGSAYGLSKAFSTVNPWEYFSLAHLAESTLGVQILK